MKTFDIAISSSAPHFEQENDILGQSFIFEFEWIEKENIWLLHIFDNIHAPLVFGIKLQTAWPLYKNHFMLLLNPVKVGAFLNRHSLKTDFRLMAYEII